MENLKKSKVTVTLIALNVIAFAFSFLKAGSLDTGGADPPPRYPMVGPPLGGFITTYFDWRWIFLINLPIGVLGMSLAFRFIPNIRDHKPAPLDWLGFGLIVALCIAVFVAMSISGSKLPLAIWSISSVLNRPSAAMTPRWKFGMLSSRPEGMKNGIIGVQVLTSTSRVMSSAAVATT